MTAILGISAFYHDSAACLVLDGQIVAAAQEERFSRIKHDAGFPDARHRVLPVGGGPRAAQTRLCRVLRQAADEVRANPGDIPGLRPARLQQLSRGDSRLAQGEAARPQPASIASWAVSRGRPVVFLDHHESHAASAFFPSPFDEAAILTLDGVGEWSTTHDGRRAKEIASA